MTTYILFRADDHYIVLPNLGQNLKSYQKLIIEKMIDFTKNN